MLCFQVYHTPHAQINLKLLTTSLLWQHTRSTSTPWPISLSSMMTTNRRMWWNSKTVEASKSQSYRGCCTDPWICYVPLISFRTGLYNSIIFKGLMRLFLLLQRTLRRTRTAALWRVSMDRGKLAVSRRLGSRAARGWKMIPLASRKDSHASSSSSTGSSTSDQR